LLALAVETATVKKFLNHTVEQDHPMTGEDAEGIASSLSAELNGADVTILSVFLLAG
jgi:hypothetical protein